MNEETEQEMPEARIADAKTESGPDPIAVLKAEIESLRDQRLRALAEAENTRRRAEREKTEASQYAVTKFARDMVSIADNFSRALAACPPCSGPRAMRWKDPDRLPRGACARLRFAD